MGDTVIDLTKDTPLTQIALCHSAIKAVAPQLLLFRYRRKLVRVHPGEAPLELDPVSLTQVLCHQLDFKKGNAKLFPPPKLMEQVLMDARTEDLDAPVLNAIYSHPVLTPDRRRILFGGAAGYHGYDPQHDIYIDTGSTRIARPLPWVQPVTRSVLAESLNIIFEPFEEFNYVNETDRSATLAMVFAQYMRPAILGVLPGVMISANEPNAGKTLLSRTLRGVVSRREMAAHNYPKNDTELEYSINDMLKDPEATFIDNANRKIEAGALSLIMTSMKSAVSRVVGKSTIPVIHNTGLIIVSGVRPEFTDDNQRRFVMINIEKVMGAKFTYGYEEAIARLPRLLPDYWWAMSNVLWAWLEAGAPESKQRVSSFEHFTQPVCGVMEFLNREMGQEVFNFSFLDEMREPPVGGETEMLMQIVEEWDRKHGVKPIKAADFVLLCGSLDLWPPNIAKASDKAMAAGKYLTLNVNRLLGHFTIRSKKTASTHAKTYCLEPARKVV